MFRTLAAAALTAAALAPAPFVAREAAAQDRTLTLGAAGLMDRRNRVTLPPITLASGQPLAEGPLELVSGGYYEIAIFSDGSAELALAGPDFFRAVWVNEVVINDLEIRPLGLDSFEFDDEGVIEMSFIAIKPGRYTLGIPGARSEAQQVQITIR